MGASLTQSRLVHECAGGELPQCPELHHLGAPREAAGRSAPRPDGTVTGADDANGEFGKMIAQGGHVTPSIESNPLTACTRIGNQRFLEAAEESEKDNKYNEI